MRAAARTLHFRYWSKMHLAASPGLTCVPLLRPPAGMVYNEKRATLAFAASDVRYGMESNRRAGVNTTRYDIGGPNDIRLEYNPCGCVYEVG